MTTTTFLSSALTDDQTQNLLMFTGDDPALKEADVLAKFVLNTGMRHSEVCGLRWDDVDLDDKLLKVSMSKIGTVRYIPIVPEVLTILLNLPYDSNSEYVFGEHRQGFFHRAVQQLAGIAPKIGLTHLPFHVLRHTFAERLFKAGISAIEVMQLGGWTSFSTLNPHMVTTAYMDAMKNSTKASE
jgi:integrase